MLRDEGRIDDQNGRFRAVVIRHKASPHANLHPGSLEYPFADSPPLLPNARARRRNRALRETHPREVVFALEGQVVVCTRNDDARDATDGIEHGAEVPHALLDGTGFDVSKVHGQDSVGNDSDVAVRKISGAPCCQTSADQEQCRQHQFNTDKPTDPDT